MADEGPARLQAGGSRGARGRVGRTKRRRQDDLLEPRGRAHGSRRSGAITVLGGRRAGSLAALDGIAFVAQNAPLYKNLSAADLSTRRAT